MSLSSLYWKQEDRDEKRWHDYLRGKEMEAIYDIARWTNGNAKTADYKKERVCASVICVQGTSTGETRDSRNLDSDHQHAKSGSCWSQDQDVEVVVMKMVKMVKMKMKKMRWGWRRRVFEPPKEGKFLWTAGVRAYTKHVIWDLTSCDAHSHSRHVFSWRRFHHPVCLCNKKKGVSVCLLPPTFWCFLPSWTSYTISALLTEYITTNSNSSVLLESSSISYALFVVSSNLRTWRRLTYLPTAPQSLAATSLSWTLQLHQDLLPTLQPMGNGLFSLYRRR